MLPDTVTERAACIAIALKDSDGLTTSQVSAMTGLTRYGAWRLMTRLSRLLPIYQDNGRWIWLTVDSVSTGDE